MKRETIGVLASIFGSLLFIGLALMMLEVRYINAGLLPLAFVFFGLGLLGLIVFGGWYYYF